MQEDVETDTATPLQEEAEIESATLLEEEAETDTATSSQEEAVIGSDSLLEEDFEKSAGDTTYFAGSMTKTWVEEETGGNHYLELPKTGTADSHLTIQNLNTLETDSESVVMEFDFNVQDEGTFFKMYFRDINGKDSDSALVANKQLTVGDVTKDLTLDTWYHYAIVLNYSTRTFSYYLNGGLIAEGTMSAEFAEIQFIRIHRTTFGDTSYDSGFKLGIDNVHYYEGEKPLAYTPPETDEPGVVIGSDTLLKEDFEKSAGDTTYFAGSMTKTWVEEETGGNHYLELPKTGTADSHLTIQNLNTLETDSESVVMEFDFNVQDEGTFFKMYFRDINGKDSDSALVANKQLTVGDVTKDLTLDTWYHYAIVLNYSTGTFSYYLNGELIATETMSAEFAEIQFIRIHRTTFGNTSYDSGFKLGIDNVHYYEGAEPLDYTPPETDEVVIGSDTLLKEEFETGVGNASYFNWNFWNSSGMNKAQVADETGENHYVEISKIGTTTGDSHLTIQSLNNLGNDSDAVVMEFDFNVQDEGTFFKMYFRDINSKDSNCGQVADQKLTAGGETKELNLNQWYKYSIVLDYSTRTFSYYLDGEQFATEAMADGFTEIKFIRIHRTTFDDTSFDSGFKLGIDNVYYYEGLEPREEVGDVTREINLTGESVFSKDEDIAATLAEYISVHKRSGVVFANGEKTMVEVSTEGEINTTKLADVLGVTLPEGTAETMTVEDFFTDVLSKQIYTDDTTVNSGMVIAGDTVYAAPTDAEELQRLNNYLFYLRPEAEDLKEMYEDSAVEGVHPRIQATQSDFDSLKKAYESNTNTYITAWADTVIQKAEGYMDDKPVIYELRDGVRLLYVSREVLDKMYAFGMAYQLTGDKKYVDRAYEDLEAVSNFPDWHPTHDLDLGEMAAAVAIGYDWMYNALTDEQRKVIEEGVYNNAFYDSVILYQTTTGSMREGDYGESNWNPVVNGGLMLASLAMADVYPDISFMLLEHNIRAAENYLMNLAPLGAWYEGPGYWEYVMQYLAKGFSTLESVYGTDMGLGKAEGLSTAARYIVNVQGDLGVFTYGDGTSTKIYCPEMMWLSDKYDDPAVTAVVLAKKGVNMTDAEDASLAMLWYDTTITADDVEDFELDAYYPGEEVASMHSGFEEDGNTFVAYHAGENGVAHGHLDAGMFVFESDGVRWALDLGMGDYNEDGYWDNVDGGARWNIFRMRAEAHNTLVINSTAAQDQEVTGVSTITEMESKAKGTILLSDLTPAYKTNADSVKRGLSFTDNRQSLVIRDEIDLQEKEGGNEVYWFMLTEADKITINNEGAVTEGSFTLQKNGKTMTLEFVANQPATLSYGLAEPLNEGTTHTQAPEKYNRIALKFEGATDELNITVKLTPDTVANPSAVKAYDVSMTEWTIPDGEIAVAPVISAMTVNGEAFEVSGASNIYYYVEGTLSEVPKLEVTAENADVSIVYGETLADSTEIYLTDKSDSTNVTKYVLSYVSVPMPESFEGKTSIPAIKAEASVEPQSENPAMNVIDGDPLKKWAGDVRGNYITLELYKTADVSGVAVVFLGGTGEREYDFVVSTSQDGVNFTQAYSGTSDKAYNTAEGTYQLFNFDEAAEDVKYVRLTVNDSTTNGSEWWTSIGEIVAYYECKTHELSHHSATTAICGTDGNTEYWECTKCGKFFSDADGTTEIAENSWVLEAPGAHIHKYTDLGDGTHKDECQLCGFAEIEAHSGGQATTTEKAKCEYCGASYGELKNESSGSNSTGNTTGTSQTGSTESGNGSTGSATAATGTAGAATGDSANWLLWAVLLLVSMTATGYFIRKKQDKTKQ